MSKVKVNLKTSHVTVYPTIARSARPSALFKNISCYSLSATVSQLLSFVSHLKTSHVTVYRYGSLTAKGIAQHLKTSHVTVYLSGGRFICLGSTDLKTSHVTVYPNPWDLLQPQDAFKNISCYSLSTTKKQYNIKYHYLKTSHVTVYRFFPFFPQVTESDLKTSHVTVYQSSHGYARYERLFKNISCYSLSKTSNLAEFFDFHLKTSHVTVYQDLDWVNNWKQYI